MTPQEMYIIHFIGQEADLSYMAKVAQDHILIRAKVQYHSQGPVSFPRLTHHIINCLAEGEATLARGKDVKAMASDRANSRAPTL